jgi:hypothetical protein
MALTSEEIGFNFASLEDTPILFSNNGEAENGIAVTSYGQGQVTGGVFSVPAHGEITVDFTLHISCVTPEDIRKMNDLIRSLVEASKQHLYDDLQQTSISGGLGYFGFWSGGLKASFTETKHTMDSWGISEPNQKIIIEAMMAVAEKTNDFNYRGTIYNNKYDYDVTGSLFGIVMDATIKQDQVQRTIRSLAPAVHLADGDGKPLLPVTGNLY